MHKEQTSDGEKSPNNLWHPCCHLGGSRNPAATLTFDLAGIGHLWEEGGPSAQDPTRWAPQRTLWSRSRARSWLAGNLERGREQLWVWEAGGKGRSPLHSSGRALNVSPASKRAYNSWTQYQGFLLSNWTVANLLGETVYVDCQNWEINTFNKTLPLNKTLHYINSLRWPNTEFSSHIFS